MTQRLTVCWSAAYLIDHQLNAYAERGVRPTMEAVWSAVDLDKQARNYRPGLDMIAFYTLLMGFCRNSGKPVFGVSGNHDCYFKPFGISPRVAGVKRANEGIPADLNLTFYEAALAFGPTWDACDMPLAPDGKPRSSFEKEWMEWFYTVFSPFENFSVRLPAQQLVCLGWGDDEDMFLGGQGIGHLPRADMCMSPVQMKLVREATAQASQRSVVVLTHFTTVSFEDKIPLFREGRPARGTLTQDTDEYVMGTFEKERAAFIELLAERKIACVLSGHSHRRGLYFLGQRPDADHDGLPERYQLPVTMYDPEDFKWSSLKQEERRPAIVVSDSAGPYPRFNKYGEFGGWGSDRPSGSVVLFDEQGDVRKVKVVRAASGQPRLAVAVDYFDVLEGSAWAGYLGTEPFEVSDEEDMLRGKLCGDEVFYKLRVALHPSLVKTKLRVVGLGLYAAADIEPLTFEVNGRQSIALVGQQNLAFHKWLNQGREPDRFVSVTLGWTGNHALAQKYEAKAPWNFEVKVTSAVATPLKQYFLERPLRSTGGPRWFPEVPDFDWRRRQAAVAPAAASGASSDKVRVGDSQGDAPDWKRLAASCKDL